ncbi:MAG: hypothetical protein WAO20_04250 [Acidobacteriota bacterium]
MARRILLLNLLLVLLVGVSAYELVTNWQEYEQEQNLARILDQAKTQAGNVEVATGPEVAPESPTHDFFVIGEKDLFSPDRRPAAVESADSAAPEAPKFPKEPVMVGVSESAGVKRALVTTYDTPKAKGNSNSYAIGDFLQGWSVSEISDTTVTLKWNDETTVIDMFGSDDSGRPPANRVAKKVASVNIVRIGSQYAAVETTSPDQSSGEQGDRPGLTQAGAASQGARPGAVPRTNLGNRRASSGAGRFFGRNASPPPVSGVVGIPGSSAQATPNPQ